jgi:hypothetical protein
MGVRSSSSSLARSPDGKHELFEVQESGPEGGGSLSYRLDDQTFTISRDFSPGDGSRPQAVPEALCRERLRALEASSVRLHFRSVKVHPEACAQARREGAVQWVPLQEDLVLTLRSVLGGAIRGGEQQLTVNAELRNASPYPFRIVWEPSGEQPLALIVDGKDRALPIGPSTAVLLGWVYMNPDDHRDISMAIDLPVGRHEIAWRYRVEVGPYGRPMENCWTGTLVTPAAKIDVGKVGELLPRP